MRPQKNGGCSTDASGGLCQKLQARLQQRLDASRFLMDAESVLTGRVHQEQHKRPVTLVDALRQKNGRVRPEEQARPSLNARAST